MRTEEHGFGGRHENMVFGKDMRTEEHVFWKRHENMRT